MNRLLLGGMALALIAVPVNAQSLEDLNIQIHGYATQGFLYTTTNNILTTSSSDGSPAWTETVVNLTSQPDPKLRIAVQARYSLLGNVGNQITLDYASADYQVNEKFGVRFGKVKTPSGLFNEIQDVDPSYMWALLPQGVYPILSRNAFLSHYGGVVYGTLKLGQIAGKLEYRAWGGERTMSSTDGYVLPYVQAGLVPTNGVSFATYGGALRWKTPLKGLMVGISDTNNLKNKPQFTAGGGALSGYATDRFINTPNWFARYENGKWMIAGESSRFASKATLYFPGLPDQLAATDNRQWYGMASYKLTEKLATGAYFSSNFNHSAALGPARYSKDWAVSGRYDFNRFLYAKVEQHFIKGTGVVFDADMNTGGLQPNAKLTILKIGVSF